MSHDWSPIGTGLGRALRAEAVAPPLAAPSARNAARSRASGRAPLGTGVRPSRAAPGGPVCRPVQP